VFAAQTGRVPAVAWLLLLANVFWAGAYDTSTRWDGSRGPIARSASRHPQSLSAATTSTAVMICQRAVSIILAWIGWRYALGIYFFGGLLKAARIGGDALPDVRDRDPESCFRAFRTQQLDRRDGFAGLVASFRSRCRSEGFCARMLCHSAT